MSFSLLIFFNIFIPSNLSSIFLKKFLGFVSLVVFFQCISLLQFDFLKKAILIFKCKRKERIKIKYENSFQKRMIWFSKKIRFLSSILLLIMYGVFMCKNLRKYCASINFYGQKKCENKNRKICVFQTGVSKHGVILKHLWGYQAIPKTRRDYLMPKGLNIFYRVFILKKRLNYEECYYIFYGQFCFIQVN